MSKITTKDLFALQDLLTMEGSICKNLNEHLNCFEDEELKSVTKNLIKRHQKRYNMLFDFLNTSV